jgi:2-amino-4-hydroxy-6-hydroxymethyldihydropteridine diphosphokinase
VARIYIAAGSSIEPEQRMQRAAAELRQRFAGIRFSACYRNRAFGFEGPDFINAVAGLDTELEPEQLIAQLEQIEALCGRSREDPKWAPRAMDLDLLLYGERIHSTARYQLPRPDLLRRIYMLQPLAELAPELIHPESGLSIAAHCAALLRTEPALSPVALDLNAP